MKYITEAEETERRKHWAYAQHSLWLEGFSFSAEDKALFERYVRGEITRNELHAAIESLTAEDPSNA